MANTYKSLALLFAGALASVLGTLFIQHLSPPRCLLYPLVVIGVILIFYGSGLISNRWKHYNLWRRRGHWLIAPKLGILSDIEWKTQYKEISTCTNISSKEWKEEIVKLAKESRVKIKVELINTKKNFDSYFAILNPYGGVYPEHDMKNYETLNKILTYVSEGGLFVNVADIPGYWVYNPLLRGILDATPPIYGIAINDGQVSVRPVRPFELTPFMEKLGLRGLNTEHTPLFNWDVEFEKKFNSIANKTKYDIKEIEVHRTVVVERNVEAIMKPKKHNDESVTPLFFVNYGNGKFLISLVRLVKYPQNTKIKKMLAETIIKLMGDMNTLNSKKIIIVLIHAFIVWALCGATIGIGRSITTMELTLIIHAIGSPIFAALVSLVYYKKFNYTSHIQTAFIYSLFIMVMDAGLVAPVFERSYDMFKSILGTWIPFILIFLSTYITGLMVKRKGA